MNKPFFTTGEVAKITGISQKTIRTYCSKGLIKADSTPVTNYRRISYGNLAAFMSKNSIPLEFMEKI